MKVTILTDQEREQVTGYGIANPRSETASYTARNGMQTAKGEHTLGYRL